MTMDTTIEQQVAMDEALVPNTQRCPFFKTFLVTAGVPKIYMQEFWATVNVHHHAIHFKMDNKKHIVNLESFRDMLHVCPRITGQSFDELPFEEKILEFIRFLGHNTTIRTLTDVNINKLYQPWRSFAAVINKCLAGKSSGYDSFRLSQAQILWGLYHKRNVDYAFLIWEDFVYQVEHKNHKKSNEMYYPRFTKVIIHHFMSKDPSIPRRNKVNWHYVRDDFMFLTIKVVSRHQNTQLYGAMLPIKLTNKEIKNTKAYKEYYAFATEEAVPKPKASARRKRSGSDSSTTPPTAAATLRQTIAATPRLTAAAKGKQPAKAPKAKSLFALSEVAMTEAEQLKLVLRRSRQQMHISQPGGSGTDEGTGSRPGVSDVPTNESEEELSWNSSDDEGADTQGKEEDDDEGDEAKKIDEQDDAEGGGDDDEESKSKEKDDDDEETREEESFEPILRTPKGSEDDENDEEEYGLKTGVEERLTEEEEADELYRDVDINQGRGIQVSQEIEDSRVTLTLVNPDGQQESSSVSSQFMSSMLNPISDAGVESIFTTASTSMASLPTPTPTITPFIIATTTTSSQVPIPPTMFPSDIIQHLPIFGLLFCFDERLKTLEANFSNFSQTNPFAKTVSRENDEFPRTVDENMKKIIKEQVKDQVKEQVSRILPRIEQSVNTQLETEVLTRSSYSSRTSYAVAADLSEMELKKILIKKMEGNKSIQRSDEQRNLYKAIVDAYEADKTILDTYGESVILKRSRDDDDDQGKVPSAGSDRGSKRRREGMEPESASAPLEPVTTHACRSTTGSRSRQASHPEWFSQPQKPPTPDRDWNKTLPAVQGSTQTWISELAKQADSRSLFNKLLDTPLDLSNFIMNRLRVDTLTPELLAGPTYELMKGSCKSLIELEYHLEEIYKATMDQLDWVNPEGEQYPHNLLQPLPFIPDNRCRHVIPFAHFINNDLKYLRGGVASRKYTTSVTKTKAADYGYIKWIEDLGRKRQQFYGFAVNWGSAHDVYSKRRIIDVTDLKIVEWHSYKHLDWISMRRDDEKIYKFKKGDFKRLRLQDIEDMMILLVQGKLSNLTVEECFAFNVSLRMFTRNTYWSDLKRREAYSAYSNLRGFIYQNKDKKNRLMRIDELHKFSDGTLNDVRTALDDRLKGIRMQYLPQTIWRKGDKDRAAAMIQAIDKMLKTRRIMRSLEKFVGGRLYEGDFRMLQRTI
uniref:Monodehydroascorbate reductase n=1 Tax=Tanacetum cinerariifolium TaxID=118510 RepID=A0A699IFJ0_TANCI|nr:hypothetical protein [Tanacetum cinerariifolium]